jgi:hypothetical protein
MYPKQVVGFSRRAIKEAGEKWEEVRLQNYCLRRLVRMRKTKVSAIGPLADSKIAWKAAVLQQALLYRGTELAIGCGRMWNVGNVLCSVLAGRALLETVALTLDFEERLQKHCNEKDLSKIDELINLHTFATKSKSLIAKAPELEAKNVLTYIDYLEKKVSGIRNHYETLSEWCHPNGYGHFFTFGTLDRSSGTVSFSIRKLRGKDLLNAILAVYVMLGLFESTMEKLSALILKVAAMQLAAFPAEKDWHKGRT